MGDSSDSDRDTVEKRTRTSLPAKRRSRPPVKFQSYPHSTGMPDGVVVIDGPDESSHVRSRLRAQRSGKLPTRIDPPARCLARRAGPDSVPLPRDSRHKSSQARRRSMQPALQPVRMAATPATSATPANSRLVSDADEIESASDDGIDRPMVPSCQSIGVTTRKAHYRRHSSFANANIVLVDDKSPVQKDRRERRTRKRLVRNDEYNERTLQNDRSLRDPTHKKPAQSSVNETIDLVSAEGDTAGTTAKRSRSASDASDTGREVLVPRRSSRLSDRTTSKTAEQREAAQELVELEVDNNAPYEGPTHLIFVFPPGERGSIRVTAEELARLEERKYLNDSLIDFYIKFLETNLLKQPKVLKQPRTFFSSFFFGRMSRDKQIDYDGVKKWTKNIDIFNQKYIFVPICVAYHWSLIIVINLCNLPEGMDDEKGLDNENNENMPRIVYLDSLDPERGKNFCNRMCQYLTEEWITRREKLENVTPEMKKQKLLQLKNLVRIDKPQIPIQSNEYDCGLYLLQCLQMFLENRNSFQDKLEQGETNLRDAFMHSDVEILRRNIVLLMKQLEQSWNWRIKGRGKLCKTEEDVEQKVEAELESGSVEDERSDEEPNACDGKEEDVVDEGTQPLEESGTVARGERDDMTVDGNERNGAIIEGEEEMPMSRKSIADDLQCDAEADVEMDTEDISNCNGTENNRPDSANQEMDVDCELPTSEVMEVGVNRPDSTRDDVVEPGDDADVKDESLFEEAPIVAENANENNAINVDLDKADGAPIEVEGRSTREDEDHEYGEGYAIGSGGTDGSAIPSDIDPQVVVVTGSASDVHSSDEGSNSIPYMPEGTDNLSVQVTDIDNGTAAGFFKPVRGDIVENGNGRVDADEQLIDGGDDERDNDVVDEVEPTEAIHLIEQTNVVHREPQAPRGGASFSRCRKSRRKIVEAAASIEDVKDVDVEERNERGFQEKDEASRASLPGVDEASQAPLQFNHGGMDLLNAFDS